MSFPPIFLLEIHHSFLDEVQIINLSLSPSEVQDLILTELMKSECAELWTLHCQMHTEKRTLQHKLSQNEVVKNYWPVFNTICVIKY